MSKSEPYMGSCNMGDDIPWSTGLCSECAHGTEVVVVGKGPHTKTCEIREKLGSLDWTYAGLIHSLPGMTHVCSWLMCPCASVHVRCSCDRG